MIRRTLLLIGLISGPLLSFSQSPILEKYIQEGLNNNLTIKQKDLEINVAMEKIREARAHFYPAMVFAPTYSVAAGGRKLQFPVGDLLNPAYQALNELKGADLFPTNIKNVNELLAPNNFHDTKVSFQYSIFNPEVRYNYLIQKTMLSAGEARKKIIENELRYAIEQGYFQYLQAEEGLKVVDSSRRVMQELVKLNQKLVNHNVLTRDAIYSAEYELSNLENHYAQALSHVRTATAYFNFLLYRPSETAILKDTLLLQTETSASESAESLTEIAMANRQEFKQIDHSIQAADLSLKMNEKAAGLPSVFVGGNAGFQGYGYSFTNQAYLVAQVGLQWQIFKGFEKKTKISQARLQTELLKTQKSELENQVKLQIAQATYQLEAAQQALSTSARGVIKAEQYFKIIDSRYRNNQVLLMEYLKAHNDMLTARMQLSISKYELLTRYASLNKIIALP